MSRKEIIGKAPALFLNSAVFINALGRAEQLNSEGVMLWVLKKVWV
jgi:hypothetical protein